MPCDFALSIGESFAELLGFEAGSAEASSRARWYLPRRNLSESLAEALKEAKAEGGRLIVTSQAVERILALRQGKSPAILMTSGFETWLGLAQPLESPPFSLRAERSKSLPIDDDFVFGVSERTGGDGRYTRAPCASTIKLERRFFARAVSCCSGAWLSSSSSADSTG